MERRATVETKSNRGVYKAYSITFKNQGHYNAWWNKVSMFGKIIGVTFEDGKSEDAWGDDPHDAMITDQRWNRIKGINE